jgi:hypothetical protein
VSKVDLHSPPRCQDLS